MVARFDSSRTSMRILIIFSHAIRSNLRFNFLYISRLLNHFIQMHLFAQKTSVSLLDLNLKTTYNPLTYLISSTSYPFISKIHGKLQSESKSLTTPLVSRYWSIQSFVHNYKAWSKMCSTGAWPLMTLEKDLESLDLEGDGGIKDEWLRIVGRVPFNGGTTRRGFETLAFMFF